MEEEEEESRGEKEGRKYFISKKHPKSIYYVSYIKSPINLTKEI